MFGTLAAPVFSSIAAILVAFVLGLGIDLTVEQQAALALVIQRILEKVFARYLNPADVAEPTLVHEGKMQAAASRATKRNVRVRN